MISEYNYSEYLRELQNQCLHTIATQKLDIHTFLFKSVFNEKYYFLTREIDEKEMNYDIARNLLYPQIQEVSIQQQTTLLPVFFYFVKGLQLELEFIIKHDPEDFWDSLFTALAYKINHIDGFVFRENLNKNQLLDFEAAMNSLVTVLEKQRVLKYLNYMFLEDATFMMAYKNSKEQDYSVFLAKCKENIITNIFNQFPSKTIDYYKLKVGIAFLKKDYTQIPYDDFLESGMYIFSLIQLDHKQFTAFFSQLQVQQQAKILQKITSQQDEGSFYKLLLLGRSLSKISIPEALQIFNLLLDKIKVYPRKEQYSVYIQFKICKLLLLQCETEKVIKILRKIIEILEIKGIKTNKKIYNQCFFLQMLLNSYLNITDSLKEFQYKNFNEGGYSLLQVLFFKLIFEEGVIFKDKKGRKQLNHILSSIREYFSIKQSVKIVDVHQFRCTMELLILNALLHHRDIYVLQYLNPMYSTFFKDIISPKNFNTSLQSQIYFFFHDFDAALRLAEGEKNKNYKLLAQIYEYQERYDEAIINYKKVFTPSSQLQCALIFQIKNNIKTPMNYFAVWKNKFNIKICVLFIGKPSKKIKKLVKQNQQFNRIMN